ncbi:Beta-glucosidase 22 [Platanthera guangdongensis]|uniref:Beta-glucosidase 22 n=1 Tax=Platanthera guangdongensis TaxID=2320717 RepID=A0ABR2LZ91_9ASPA
MAAVFIRSCAAVLLTVLPLLLPLLFGKSSRLLALADEEISGIITRDDFPPSFIFGAGTSAYQYEGATTEDGRAPCIWDTFAHSGHLNGSTADVASDGYHKYKEDIKHMSEIGLEGYRFSISWSRLLPSGRGPVNPKGLEYYNNVINELIKYGIQPFVTIHHYDFPQVLQDEYGGWLSPKIIDDFKEFAEVCFREFGDRVQHWTTMNEPNVIAMYAFDYGILPPQRCSHPFGNDCKGGNSTIEPYIVAHHMILSHSAAVQLYRTKYQAIQKGKIGINLSTLWSYPLTESIADVLAAKRTVEFFVGWFVNPIVFGDYPEVMRENAGLRLPSFTKSEFQLVKGSFDFIGINYYFSIFSANNYDLVNSNPRDMSGDILAKYTAYKDRAPVDRILPPSPLPNNPRGLPKLLKFFKDTYGNPPVYILENGFGIEGKEKLADTDRISYLSGFIGSVLKALRDGSDVRGYYIWSFVDQFEFTSGYKLPMGLFRVKFNKGCERVPKKSAFWYSNFIKNGGVINYNQADRRPRTQPISYSSI